jgi:hypothetical protein
VQNCQKTDPSRVVMIFEAFLQDFFGISIFGHLFLSNFEKLKYFTPNSQNVTIIEFYGLVTENIILIL